MIVRASRRYSLLYLQPGGPRDRPKGVRIHSVGDRQHGTEPRERAPLTHTDPYRLTTTPDDDASTGVSRGDVVRTLLWSVVVISAVANTVASYGGSGTALHLASGIVTVLAAGTLVVRSLRGRR